MMRTDTHTFLARLPARKRAAMIMLLVLVCGGMVAGGSVLS
jgi:hypothetical protein